MENNKEIYPLTLKLNNNISNGFARGQDEHTIIENDDAIELHISINSSQYRRQDVYKSLSTICQKALEYYCE